MELAAAKELWEPESIYLNTASYGLPPRPAFDELTSVLADWRAGRTSWESWGEAAEASRGSFARLAGVSLSEVSIGTTVSSFVGLIAGSLPDGARVVAPNIEFASNLFPFFVHPDRGVTVETVPAARLADSIDSSTTAVAFSTVQSSTGEVADLDAICGAASDHRCDKHRRRDSIVRMALSRRRTLRLRRRAHLQMVDVAPRRRLSICQFGSS